MVGWLQPMDLHCRPTTASLRRPLMHETAISPCPPLHAFGTTPLPWHGLFLHAAAPRTHHGNGIKRASHRTQRAPGAARRIVQGGALGAPGLRALHLQRQHMRRAHGNAPAAAGTALGVDGRQGLAGGGGHGALCGGQCAAAARTAQGALQCPHERRTALPHRPPSVDHRPGPGRGLPQVHGADRPSPGRDGLGAQPPGRPRGGLCLGFRTGRAGPHRLGAPGAPPMRVWTAWWSATCRTAARHRRRLCRARRCKAAEALAAAS